jgi:hypothetical protein
MIARTNSRVQDVATKRTGGPATMTDADIKKLVKELTADDRADEEINRAAQGALAFLSTCVDGKVEGASVADRIHAAQVILQHASTRHDLLADLLGSLSGDDVAAAVGLLT